MRTGKNKKLVSVMMIITVLAFAFSSVKAQIKLTAQVSSNKVQVGTPFQIMFSVNTIPTTYTPPRFKVFDVYSGPNPTQSTLFINGAVSQACSISFLIAAKKEGKITIDPMTMVAGGQTYKSNVIVIEASKGNVSPNGNTNAQNQQQQNNQTTTEEPAYSTKITGEEVFIRTSVSKTKCYLGEQVTITQKIYSRMEIRGIQSAKFPSYNGFWAQQAEGLNNVVQNENLDGVVYQTGEFSRTFVFPQRTGKLTIDPTELEIVVRRQTNKKPRNIFEQFFGTGGYEDLVVKAKSKPVSVDVTALPETNKPEGFTGGVGNFTYKVEATRKNLKANDAFNLKVTINGKGNIKIFDPPKLNLPESFESYEPKINENISNVGAVSGTKVYDYLVIPREPGEFVMDDLKFSFFNTDKKEYVTVSAPPITITVTPGDGKSNATAQVFDHLKQEIKETENDIRYIKKGNFELQKGETEFFNSSAHIMLMLLPAFLLLGGLGYRSYYLKHNSNTAAVLGRKAAKVAKKQLAQAEKLMRDNNKEGFYTEVMTALNNYVSHKFNLPLADLSKENITAALQAKQINPQTQLKLFDTLNQCEYAKYAPGAVSGDLNMVYNNTVELISNIENEIKNA